MPRAPDLLRHISVTLNSLENAFDKAHDSPCLLLTTAVFCLSILEIGLNSSQIIFHSKQKLLFVIESGCLSLAELLPQSGDLEFQFFDLVALQVDELEHLEVLLFIPAENSEQFVKIVDLCCCFDLREVLPELLDLLHLLRTLLRLPKSRRNYLMNLPSAARSSWCECACEWSSRDLVFLA